MDPIAIQADNLTKHYPLESGLFARQTESRPSVSGVSLLVKRGEIFGLTGANGAGKTTLAKMLCTLISPTSGNVPRFVATV